MCLWCVCERELEDNLGSCSSDCVLFGLGTQGLSLAWRGHQVASPRMSPLAPQYWDCKCANHKQLFSF